MMRTSIGVRATSIPVLVLALALAFCLGALLLPRVASAGECREACSSAKRTCVLEGKTALRACKEACHDAGTPGECRRSCRAAFSSAKHVCKDAVSDCRDACDKPHPPCIDDCTGDLRACLDGVHDRGRSCASDCLARARREARDCRGNPAPLRCLGDVGRHLGSCMHHCAAQVGAGVGGCMSDFRECRADQCGGYGSASRAFLNPPVDLLQ